MSSVVDAHLGSNGIASILSVSLNHLSAYGQELIVESPIPVPVRVLLHGHSRSIDAINAVADYSFRSV